MNRVSLLGRLTKDPSLFDSQNGKIAKFNIATKTGYDKEKNEERTEFVPVTAFGIQDAFVEYLIKGRMVSVDGRVSTDRYEKDGKDVFDTSVKVQNGGLNLVGSAPKDQEDKPEAPAE